MTDGKIRGTGNSRFLKTVANITALCPDYETFMAVLAEGRFPIDLNGLNEEGWEVLGTLMNKVNLLSDATASSLGLSSTATINQAFAAIPTAAMLNRMIVNSSTLTSITMAANDNIPLQDVSAATSKKITVQEFLNAVKANVPKEESTFQKLIMGRLF